MDADLARLEEMERVVDEVLDEKMQVCMHLTYMHTHTHALLHIQALNTRARPRTAHGRGARGHGTCCGRGARWENACAYLAYITRTFAHTRAYTRVHDLAQHMNAELARLEGWSPLWTWWRWENAGEWCSLACTSTHIHLAQHMDGDLALHRRTQSHTHRCGFLNTHTRAHTYTRAHTHHMSQVWALSALRRLFAIPSSYHSACFFRKSSARFLRISSRSMSWMYVIQAAAGVLQRRYFIYISYHQQNTT